MTGTPASLGYRMPAEWERHDATWLSWPKDPNTFPPSILPKVEDSYAKMVEALGEGEEVRILVDDAKTEERAKRLVKKAKRVSFARLKTVDVWVRDYGPTYVTGRDLALVRWRFNAWGNKYEDLLPDDASGDRIADTSGVRVFRPGIVLEGGSIEVDGKGTVLTTEQCLLNPNRNPMMRRKDLESALMANLRVNSVIWLRRGIEGDDTDGHVDDVARYVEKGKVVVATEKDVTDSNHAVLEENQKLLEQNDLDTSGIPMPSRTETADGRLPASHMNFYIGNSAVVVPTFGGSSDREAIRTLEGFFSDREIVGIDCRALVYGLGTLHCVTQQIPSV